MAAFDGAAFGSGSSTASRNEFQRMLEDCRAKKLDIILTKSISRFGRNTVETLAGINDIRLCNVEICFDQDELSTNDPSSTFLISILEGLAQEESAARSKSISWGIQRKAENGTALIFNRKCYGYCYDADGNLQINEAEAEVVRLVFNMYLQGMSVIGILRELEAKSVKSPAEKDKWCKRSIDVMLSNEKYSGDVIVFKTYNTGYPQTVRKTNLGERERFIAVGNHPAIITKDVFSAVRAEKERRSNIVTGENGSNRKSCRYSSKRDGVQGAAFNKNQSVNTEY